MSRTIIEAIQKLSGTQLKNNLFCIPATVLSVDEGERTCVVEAVGGNEAIRIEGVQLMASVDDGLLIIPEIESNVIVSYSTLYPAFISQFSSINKFLLIVGANQVTVQVTNEGLLVELNETKLSLTDGKIQFNDGAFEGLVKVGALTDKLNAPENQVNQLKQIFAGWTPIPNDGGAALKGAVSTWASQQMQPTQKEQIENDKVTHG